VECPNRAAPHGTVAPVPGRVGKPDERPLAADTGGRTGGQPLSENGLVAADAGSTREPSGNP
jgi:hypothetical protein